MSEISLTRFDEPTPRRRGYVREVARLTASAVGGAGRNVVRAAVAATRIAPTDRAAAFDALGRCEIAYDGGPHATLPSARLAMLDARVAAAKEAGALAAYADARREPPAELSPAEQSAWLEGHDEVCAMHETDA